MTVKSLESAGNKYVFCSGAGFFGILGSAVVASGRFLPGHHDVIDLVAGALLGCFLGVAWNEMV